MEASKTFLGILVKGTEYSLMIVFCTDRFFAAKISLIACNWLSLSLSYSHSLSLSLSLTLSIYLFIFLSIYLSIYTSLSLFIYPSIYLFIYLSIYSSICIIFLTIINFLYHNDASSIILPSFFVVMIGIACMTQDKQKQMNWRNLQFDHHILKFL